MATKKQNVVILKLTCEVCGHKWESREKPLRCAKCKTPYWDRKREAKRTLVAVD